MLPNDKLPLSIPTSTITKTLPFYHSTNNQSKPLTLHTNSIYMISPPHPQAYKCPSPKSWMIMVRELTPGKLFIHHPLTAKEVDHSLLPPHFNINEFGVTKLAQGYRLENSNDVQKVLIISFSSNIPSTLQLLVLYNKRFLAKLTVSNQDSRLEVLDTRAFGKCYFDDVVYHNGMFCAVDREGRMYKLNLEAMNVEKKLVSSRLFSYGSEYAKRRKRLVVDYTSGELHLVACKSSDFNICFKLYKYNEGCEKWDEVHHLGCDRVLFVGVDHCFFGKAKDFPGCNGNCIVFGANCFPNYFRHGTDDGLFGCNADTEVGVYVMGMGDNFGLLSSVYPDFSSLIWPPPTWIFDTSRSVGTKMVLISSSIELTYPDYPPDPSCTAPWIVSSVEIGGETKLFDPLSGDALPNLPRFVFLNHPFSVVSLANHYHIANVNDNKQFPKSLFHHGKVIRFDYSSDLSLPPKFEDCNLLVLSKTGQLTGFRPVEYGIEEVHRFNISYESVDVFDDILRFKGIVYTIDRLGKLYKMHSDTFGELEIVIENPNIKSDSPTNIWRKRLVGSPWDEELYMIVRNDMEDIIDVYKLCEQTKRSWIKVHAFENEQVLILCRVYGFFAPDIEFPNCPPFQNCILFYDAFTPTCLSINERPTKKPKAENEIHVYWLGEDSQYFKPISSYPGFPALSFFTTPKWFMQSCKSEPEEDKLMKPGPKIAEEKLYNANSKPLPLPPTSQSFQNRSSTVKFEDVDIKSELLPTLQRIREKHGNLIGENTIRNNKMRALALESAVKLEKDVQNAAKRGFISDFQASEIKLDLDDLKRVGLNKDWLDQVAEKVRRLQENKPIVEAIMDLEKNIAQIEEEKRKFLENSTSKMQKLEEEIAVLSAKISFPVKPTDFDD